MKSHTALLLTLLTAAAHGGPRTSTDYTIPADTADAGGQRTTSSAYTNDGSLGASPAFPRSPPRHKPPRPATSASSPK